MYSLWSTRKCQSFWSKSLKIYIFLVHFGAFNPLTISKLPKMYCYTSALMKRIDITIYLLINWVNYAKEVNNKKLLFSHFSVNKGLIQNVVQSCYNYNLTFRKLDIHTVKMIPISACYTSGRGAPHVVGLGRCTNIVWWPRRVTLALRRRGGRWGDAMDDEAMRWTMRRCDGRWGDAMDDEAMLWGDGRWGDAMDDEAMRWTMRRCDGNIAPSHRPIASPHRPSHRLMVHRIASSSIASPHRPSHRLIVHRIASSPSA